MFEVTNSRFDYFQTRISLAEERIFSHTQTFARGKLTGAGHNNQDQGGITTINNIHAIIGSQARKWVFGVLTQKEDTHIYLEDSTYSIKLDFSELEYADPDSFFTENCIILCQGYFKAN